MSRTERASIVVLFWRMAAVAAVSLIAVASLTADHEPSRAAATGGQGPAMTVARALDGYQRSAGGRERLRALRSLVADAVRPGERGETRRWEYRWLHPASVQVVEELPRGSLYPTRVVTAVGTQGWARGALVGVKPFGGDALDAAAQARVQSRRFAIEIALGIAPSLATEAGLIDLSYGGTVRDAGERLELIALDVRDDIGPFGCLYLRTDNYLPVRVTTKVLGTFGQVSTITRTIRFEDYRPVAGLLLPFTIDDGAHISVTRYRLDTPLGAELFRPPKGQNDLERLLSGTRRE